MNQTLVFIIKINYGLSGDNYKLEMIMIYRERNKIERETK